MKRNVKSKWITLLVTAALTVMAGCGDNTASGGNGANASETPAASAESSSLSAIKEKGKIIIATGNYYPFEYLDPQTQKLVGYDIDLGNKIGEKLGVEVEWKEMQFTALIPSVQNGQVDMGIAAMYITDERKAAVDMSDVYMETGMTLVKRAGDDSIQGVEDLAGKVVGVKSGATSEAAAKELKAKGTDLEIKAYKDTTDYLMDLQLGRVDAAFNDYLNQMGYNKQHADAGLEIVGKPFTNAGLGLAVQKGNTVLLEAANEVIKEMEESGEAAALYEKWLK
ncbi:substrate-binding periplasmic protein [Paenibacillus stellifer]|uniref:substrate-binding periplasmic protein n=1 Tax=Paenibacillus stellifer TaxID=169760 RepID=UPI00068B698D|nr:transporter substrate-binding domain-containing protein [Paenibacillus stellifer]